MQPHIRTLITIVTEAVIEKELVAALEELGVRGYTISDARGKGHRGVRTAGWEHGANIRMEVVCEEATAERVVTYLRDNYYENYAMIVYVSEVKVLRPEKF